MRYQHTITGIFLERPNRFLAYVQLKDKVILSHVKNTGRCRELLIPGVRVIVEFHPNAKLLGRKTEYSLIGVYKSGSNRGDVLINMDSQAPNTAVFEWLSLNPSVTNLQREVTFRKSRFDLSYDLNHKKSFMEVKGVTLETDGVAQFPDAPTERGIKHLLELKEAVEAGYNASIFFLIQMKGVHTFIPNQSTHPEFARVLQEVVNAGVSALAYDCFVTEDSMTVDSPIEICLGD